MDSIWMDSFDILYLSLCQGKTNAVKVENINNYGESSDSYFPGKYRLNDESPRWIPAKPKFPYLLRFHQASSHFSIKEYKKGPNEKFA